MAVAATHSKDAFRLAAVEEGLVYNTILHHPCALSARRHGSRMMACDASARVINPASMFLGQAYSKRSWFEGVVVCRYSYLDGHY